MKKALAALTLLALAGCSAPAPAGGASPAAGTKTLRVFAAASLAASFDQLKVSFEQAHPGVSVQPSYDGSSALVDQLSAGAKADVFASADEKNMTRAADAHLVAGTPRIFATNVLTLVVAPGNPAGITGLDASLDGKKLVVCATGVPCGNATAALAKGLGVTLRPVSTEQKVTDVLGKVTSGEADAGLVYATDAKGAGDRVTTVAVPGADRVVNRYPIAVTAAAPEPELAQQFVDLVTGPEGEAVLAQRGFGKP